MIFDRLGRCLTINGTGLDMMGLSETDCLEKNFEEFWPENVRGTAVERIGQALKGVTCSFESPFLRPDDSELLWNVELKPTYSRKGNLKGFVAISTDITKYRKAEDELEGYREHFQKLVDQRTEELKKAILKAEEERARYESIVAAIGDGFSIHGTDFRILYQNQVARDLLGDHVGEYCFEAYMGADSVCERCHIAEVFKDGKVHKKDGTARTASGVLHIEITASPLRDSSGKIVAGIEVVRDVTDRKVSEETLRQTNERLRTILDASPAAIIALDSGGTVTLWNRSAEKIFGWSAAEVMGRFYPVVPEDDIDEFRAMLEHVLRGQPVLGAQFSRRRKDGSPVDIMISAGPLHATGGNISGVLAVVTDMTASKKTEQDLKLAHAEFKQIFNTAAGGMIVIDRNFNILRVNDTFRALLGADKDKITGRKCHEVFTTASLCHTSNCPMERILMGEEGVEIEAEKTRRDGTKFPAIIRAAPFINPEGDLIGIVEDIRDIGEHRKMEEAVLKAKNLESVGLLAGGLAHDFNNLLQGLLGNISIAASCLKPDDRAWKYLEQAQNISGIAKSLTGQLLTFSRGYTPLRKPFLLGEKLRDWVSFALSGTNLKGEFDIEDHRCMVEADEGQLRQVIQNLVLNARDAMPYGGTLNVGTQMVNLTRAHAVSLKEGSYIKLSITDQGTGIPEKNLSRIFDPYFSTKNIGSRKGMGLGLAICHSIINKHGGTITAESRENVGSIFTIYLPLSEKEVTSEATVVLEGEQAVDYKGKVLVMDDEKIVTDVAKTYLTQLGYESEAACDGDEAIEMYKNAERSGSPFDIVILDLTIPGGLGGKETMARLLEINVGVKAIVSTGYSQEPIMSSYRRAGFMGALPKPYTLDELSAVLSQVRGQT